MTFRLITADERLLSNYDKVTGAIFGRSKVGKTWLVKTLRADETLFFNLEAGMKSIQDYRGPNIDIETFEDAADAACLFGGISPSSGPMDFFHANHYDYVRNKYKSINPDWFRTGYWDSITDLTRLAMTWAQRQPAAFGRYGKPDLRGAYGEMGRQVIRMLRHIQHTPGKNVFFVGGLNAYVNEVNQQVFEPQSEGNKTKTELPYIVDQIMTLSDFDYTDAGFIHNFGKGRFRALCCKSPNPWGLPAGDRSGRLNMIEEPHLGRLIEKINSRPQPAQLAAAQ
jgi:hypothetical protein